MKEFSVAKAVLLLWYRMSDAVRFYNEEAQRSSEAVMAGYLHYLSEKKRSQLVVFEKLSSSLADTVELPPFIARKRRAEHGKYCYALHAASLIDIYDFALQCSENDMDFFRNCSILAHEEPVKRILSALLQWERDFFFDTQIGYIDFLSRQIAQETSDISASLYEPQSAAVAL